MTTPTPTGQLGWRAPKNVQVAAPVMVAQAAMPTPGLIIAVTVPAPATPMLATATIPAPAITLGHAVTVPVPVMAAAAAVLPPTIISGHGVTVPAPVMRTAATMPAPTTAITFPPPGPTFDAVSAGVIGTAATLSAPHTAAAGADVYAFLNMRSSSGTVTSITYGGLAMTLFSKQYVNGGTSGAFLAVYRLTGAPGGTQTVTGTTASSTNGWGFFTISYTTITSATPTTTFGAGSPTSQALACAANQMITWGASAGGTNTVTGISGGTQRATTGTNAVAPLVIVDSPVSTTFSASFGALGWATVGIVLA